MSGNTRVVDLRSDTITRPTAAMRQAIATAEVGDDVYGEDPTVAKLERMVAETLGKEAALFVPTGVMANQISIHCHTRPGQEVFCSHFSHVYYYESGAPALLSGVTMVPIHTRNGIFTAADLNTVSRPDNIHFPPTSLVCVENTVGGGGGIVWPLESLAEVSTWCKARGIALHMDGARLWNASVASGIPEREYASLCDSVSVCFSKGLGAPVGSAVVGTKEFIARARAFRKVLGGGMRQVGIIAAGALYALENNRPRLADDHANAKRFAVGISKIPGIAIDVEAVQTNILMFSLSSATRVTLPELVDSLKKQHILVSAVDSTRIRVVTSMEVTERDMETAIAAIAAALA
ncbi:threonine aldolase [Pelomyxa schiedti]|nr:threonine aldolase [Pelomyxa schiedti]